MAFFLLLVTGDEVVCCGADGGDGFADVFPLLCEGAGFVVAADFVGAVPGAGAVELPFAATGDGISDGDALNEVVGVVYGFGGGAEVCGAVEGADAVEEVVVAGAEDDFVAFLVGFAGGEFGDVGGGVEAGGGVCAVEVVGVVGWGDVAGGEVVGAVPVCGTDVVLVECVFGVLPGDFLACGDSG